MSERFHKLVDLMAALRAPNGCPWDRKQTHESLKPYLLEETYEVLEILDRQDRTKLPEELGDVLLQVLFHSQIAAEAGSFTIEDVLEQLADKLTRRHPHVFGNRAADTDPDECGSGGREMGRHQTHGAASIRTTRLGPRRRAADAAGPPESLPGSSTRLARRLRLDPRCQGL